MKLLLPLFALISLLAACATTPPPTNGTPDPDPDPTPPLVVTIRDYYGTNGNRTLVLVDIISNRAVTLNATATCTLSNGTGGGFTLIGYEGRITLETQGSDRSLHWSNRGAPDSTARTIQCNTLEGTTGDGESVRIRLR